MPNFTADSVLNQSFDAVNTALDVSLVASVLPTGAATEATLSAINTNTAPLAPQAYGLDVAGADAYATVVTTTAIRHHIYIYNSGANDAIVSLDGGVTGHFYLPGQTAFTFDNILIANGANIQAKNGVAGSNYANLYISVW